MKIELASTGPTAQSRETLEVDGIIVKLGNAGPYRNAIHGRAFQRLV
jgi:hypothetical protein